MARKLLHKVFFRLHVKILPRLKNLKSLYYKFLGLKLAKGTILKNVKFTWPHQVKIGSKCIIEHDIYFHYDGQWSSGPSIIIGEKNFIGFGVEFNIRKEILIGDNCLIASGCKFIDHDHGMTLGSLMNSQVGPEAGIYLEDDVWLGVNVVVLKGVTIGKGAVVGANAVVTKSIPSYEIWGGIPAKKIRERKSYPLK